jgi:quinol monooxygenase YgiN
MTSNAAGGPEVGWHVELELRPGGTEAFVALTREMADAARDEPGCLRYERFVDAERGVVDVYEAYADARAAFDHLETFAGRFSGRFEPLVQRRHFHLYGAVDAELAARTAPLGARRFDRVVVAADHDVAPDAVERVAAELVAALGEVLAGDDDRFDRPVPGSAWHARRTVDHLADALTLYARYVATRATGPLSPLRDGRPAATVAELLADVADAATLLRRLLGSMGPGERAFHPAGAADRSGWAAMACDELLVHGLEVAGAVGAAFDPADADVEAVVARLFPWAPPQGSARERLAWCNGRAPLGDRPQLDPSWYWWSRPLWEWDGRRHRRTKPPAW